MKCTGCGKKLKGREVSIIGPYTMVWCYNPICRGQAKFIQEAVRIKDHKKLKELMKTANPEMKLLCQCLMNLMEKSLIFHINEDLL